MYLSKKSFKVRFKIAKIEIARWALRLRISKLVLENYTICFTAHRWSDSIVGNSHLRVFILQIWQLFKMTFCSTMNVRSPYRSFTIILFFIPAIFYIFMNKPFYLFVHDWMYWNSNIIQKSLPYKLFHIKCWPFFFRMRQYWKKIQNRH